MQTAYRPETFDAATARQQPGLQVLEFGTNWCGHCQAAQALLQPVLAQFPEVAHHAIEDGPGRRLGRAYAVKLWPTLVFLHDGVEVSRLVRPGSASLIEEALEHLVGEG